MSETEVSEIGRDDFTAPETLGLTRSEGKLLTAAVQAEIPPKSTIRVAVSGDRI